MMKRLPYIVPIAAFAVLVIAFYIGLRRPAPDTYPSMLVGKPAPEVSLPALDAHAKAFAAADLASGHVTVVNLFAHWCIPCRLEGPGLAEIASLKGVALYGIAYKDSPDKAREFLNEMGNPYSRIDLDGDGRAGIEWGITGVPETFVVDAKGIVRLRYAGPLIGDALTAIVLPAIRNAEAE